MKIESDKMLLRAMQSLESILQYASQMAGCGGQTCSLAEKRPPTGALRFPTSSSAFGRLKEVCLPNRAERSSYPVGENSALFLASVVHCPNGVDSFLCLHFATVLHGSIAPCSIPDVLKCLLNACKPLGKTGTNWTETETEPSLRGWTIGETIWQTQEQLHVAA